MADERTVGELELFLAERADRLMRVAVLLTGGRDAGQDLLQTALERLIRHWRTPRGDPEAYLRRTLYNLAADGFRRQGRLQRKLLLLQAGTRPPADPITEVDLRDALVRIHVPVAVAAAGGLVLQVLGTARPRPRPRPCSAGRKAPSSRPPPAGCGGSGSSPTAGTQPGAELAPSES